MKWGEGGGSKWGLDSLGGDNADYYSRRLKAAKKSRIFRGKVPIKNLKYEMGHYSLTFAALSEGGIHLTQWAENHHLRTGGKRHKAIKGWELSSI